MNRRLSFKKSCAGALLLSCPEAWAKDRNSLIRFGLVTDIHFAHREMQGTRYYKESADYDSGNFDWTKAYIPPTQKEWLRKELEKGDLPVLIFIHQLLDQFSGVDQALCIGNASEVVQILEASKRVIDVDCHIRIEGFSNCKDLDMKHRV